MKNRKRIGAVWIGGLCGTALLLCGAAAANESVAEQSGASVTIEIDYGDCDVRELPKGQAGKSYPVFGCVASDENGNSVNDVRITVKSPSGKIVPQKGGRFETAETGDYVIEYAAVSGFASAVKTVTISVEKYTDSLQYNAEGELVPGTGVTGYAVFALFGKYAGGVGDLIESTTLKFGTTELALEQTENGMYFLPEKQGEYVLTYSAKDFIGDEKRVEKTVVVKDSAVPVLTKASLPASAIAGETLDLPLCDGVLYRDGAKYYLPVKTTFDGADVSETMRAENLAAGNHTITYECVNPADRTQKAEYSFALTVKSPLTDEQKKAGARLFDNYFDFENCEPFAGAGKEYKVKVNAGTAAAKFAFSREIPVNYLNFDLSTLSGAAEYDELYCVMTDSKRAADCIKVKIRRLSSYSHLWISYNEESKSLINADTGATIAEIRSYDDGRAFEGFGSGKAYISFEAKGVKKDIVFTLKKAASNVITTDSNDYASPVFLENPEYKAIYVSYAGHSVTFPKMEAFDLLDKNVTVTLKVYDDEGTVIYEGTDAYTLHIGQAGEYTADYTVYDSNGNRKLQQSTVYVADTEAPQIRVSGIKAAVKAGEEITLPTAEITDNATPAEEIASYIYVIKGNNRKQLAGKTYKFTEAGEYIIRYVAYDSYQNYTVAEFTITCK